MPVNKEIRATSVMTEIGGRIIWGWHCIAVSWKKLNVAAIDFNKVGWSSLSCRLWFWFNSLFKNRAVASRNLGMVLSGSTCKGDWSAGVCF